MLSLRVAAVVFLNLYSTFLMLSLSIAAADPSRADHTNRAARGGNECLSRVTRSFAAPKLAAPVRCLRDCRGNYAAGVVMQHQCPPTRYHAKSLTLSGGSVRWCAD